MVRPSGIVQQTMHAPEAYTRGARATPGAGPADLLFTASSLAHLFTVFQRRWREGWTCSSETRFALGTSVLWTIVYNLQFWHQTVVSMWHATPGSTAFLASLFVLVVCVQAMLVLLMPTKTLMRLAASASFLVAAAGSYFCSAYGAVMSKDMLRNALETDPAEVGGLVTGELILVLLVFGVLPAILVWKVSLPKVSWTRRAWQRAVFVAGAAVVCLGGLLVCSADYAVFFREYKPIRFTLVPAAPISSMAGLLSSSRARGSHLPLLNPGGNAVRTAQAQTRPLVMFVIVGETARAQNFQLGGYARSTTPRLQAIENLVYLGPASACGTSTAWSVPCMFSHEGRKQFDVDEAARSTNVLDSLVQAGLDVEWRDNNSGCKGVCSRVDHVSYSDRPDPQRCPRSYCYDEVMLTGLAARLRDIRRDTVIVFHQVGSHGPAYAERYPPAFERFKPACRSNRLQECTAQEIVNAYDNTIAYTDHVLARLIGLLREASDRLDGILIYASDHGESLGEQGLYLHGMPYAFAPETQKEVPMLLWTSAAYDARVGMDRACLRARADEHLSHDNLYHTILGATGVSNKVYDSRLDILSGCRNGAARAPGERRADNPPAGKSRLVPG